METTKEDIARDLRFYRAKYKRAKENEDKGIFLWSKKSEHYAEMHYLKVQVERLFDQLQEVNK